MKYEPLNAKQVWLIIALAVAAWIPATIIITMENSGALHLSDRQMATVGAVNLILMNVILIGAYRKWISKIKG
jgi:hypothetical protein